MTVGRDGLRELDWQKQSGLLPAIVQDSETSEVLMLGYMNEEALDKTLDSGRVHFFSRSRQALWCKGETSGNELECMAVTSDCDRDTLLVLARPTGPVCHTGQRTCFGAGQGTSRRLGFLGDLSDIIAERATAGDDGSYTASLLRAGTVRIAKKVGEEAVEVALASVAEDDASLLGEAADLVYHLMTLLHSRGLSLEDVAARLESRHVPGARIRPAAK